MRSTPGPGLLADGEHAGQLAGRRHELGDVGREGEERAQRDLVVQGQPSAEGEDGNLAERGNRLEQRLVPRLEPDRAHLRAVERLVERRPPAPARGAPGRTPSPPGRR